MTDQLTVTAAAGPVEASIAPPGSKSLTNRALIIAAAAQGDSKLHHVLRSDDTQAMSESLKRMGVRVTENLDGRFIHVSGTGGQFESDGELFVGNSGTSIRFLTAMLGFAGGNYRLDGIARMRQRPIGPLIDALSSLGAKVKACSPNQCPPVEFSDSPRLSGGEVKLGGNLSSQYLSGLLMAAPLANESVALEIEGELISKPYVEMTCQVMEAFGVQVDRTEQLDRFEIAAGQSYRGRTYLIEPDASAASYFWATAAILGGKATVLGLNRQSLQGDVQFVDCLKQMGCELDEGENHISVLGPAKHGIHVDMSNISDTVQTLAAVALFVDSPTTVTNIAHNRVKETDRIGNLAIELRKLGAKVDEQDDGLTIYPGPTQPATIETYDDHRMAMSLSLAGLRQPGVTILDPGCVSKTYPNYFADLEKFVSS